MIGDYYWTTGIRIYQQYPGTDNSWLAKINFEDDSHAQIGGSKGSLSTKYQTSLMDSIKTIRDDAQKLGIQIKSISDKPHLYVCELLTNNAETWHQINTVADELGLSVIPSLP